MPQPCSVCAHLERGSIDQRLSLQVCNMAQVARDYGLGKDAVRSHRDKHLPQFLPAFKASAAALTLGTLQAESMRLYEITLDALARAEAGVLVDVTKDGVPVVEVSMTSIARFIKEARQGLGLIAKLSADAGEENARPEGIPNGELSARISEALGQVIERGTSRIAQQPIEAIPSSSIEGNAVECIDPDLGLARAPSPTTPGATPAERPYPSPPQVSGFSATPPGLPEDKSDRPRFELAPRSEMMRHPEWPGSDAASKEERAAEGYADIAVEDHVQASDAILQEQLRIAIAKAARARQLLRDDPDDESLD